MTARVPINGIELAVAEHGPASGPVVVLLHGFPELGFSWRHQVGPLAAAGYRVLVPDMRGFGDSDAPDDAAQETEGDPRPPDGQLDEFLAAIGRQVGLFVERSRATATMQRSEARLQLVIENLNEVSTMLDNEDENALREYMTRAKVSRDQLRKK